MPQTDLNRLDCPPRILAQLRVLLARHVPQADAWAYGSRVKGTAHETSDLDVVLRHAEDPLAEVAGWSDLQEAVQQSTIPITVDIHPWPHLPVGFHREIQQGYVVVQKGRA